MKKLVLMMAIGAAAMMGCSSTDDGNTGGVGGIGGEGGMGGMIGPLAWVASDLTITGMDECEFFSETEALTFDMNIQGSNLTLQLRDTTLVLAADDYMETDDEVLVTDSTENSEFDPCIVMLDNAMQLGLDDPDTSIDQNSTLSVTWTHVEEEVSMDECMGVWFVDLPCAGEATLTLTQTPPPSSP